MIFRIVDDDEAPKAHGVVLAGEKEDREVSWQASSCVDYGR